MKIKDLIKILQKIQFDGYGDKDIITQDGDMDLHIDNVCRNTHKNVEPDYFFIMSGNEVDNNFHNCKCVYKNSAGISVRVKDGKNYCVKCGKEITIEPI